MGTTWEDIIDNNWELFHLGLVVKDLDKTFDYYQSLGLVTSLVKRRPSYIRPTFEEHGKPREERDYPTKVKIFRMGPLPFEMLQYKEGSKTPNNEFLENQGEGIAHIGFLVDDLEAETAKLTRKGIQVVLTEKTEGKVTMRYFDTRKLGGLLLELKLKGTEY
jgi:catechol 2,3-dioxygenase-like lactoylglutathione lyase family enzyme